MMTYNFEKLLLNILMFWIPVPTTVVMTYVWWKRTESLMITTTAIFLPLLYGYVIPGIGITVLKKWRFTKGYRIGGMYWHHGFMYASKMSFFGFVPLLLYSIESLTTRHFTLWIFLPAALYTLTAWLQDFLSFKHNYVEANFTKNKLQNATKKNASLLYAPVCFTMIGLIYSISLVCTALLCPSGRCSFHLYSCMFLLSFSAMSLFPSLAYKLLTD